VSNDLLCPMKEQRCEQTAAQILFGFAAVEGRRIEAGFDGGAISSDGGALLLKATDRALAVVDRFAGCFQDNRRADLIEHEVRTLVVSGRSDRLWATRTSTSTYFRFVSSIGVHRCDGGARGRLRPSRRPVCRAATFES